MPAHREERYKYFGIGDYKVRIDSHLGGSLIILVTHSTYCVPSTLLENLYTGTKFTVEKPNHREVK